MILGTMLASAPEISSKHLLERLHSAVPEKGWCRREAISLKTALGFFSP